MAVTLSLYRIPLAPEMNGLGKRQRQEGRAPGRWSFKAPGRDVRRLEQRGEAGLCQEWADSRLVV